MIESYLTQATETITSTFTQATETITSTFTQAGETIASTFVQAARGPAGPAGGGATLARRHAYAASHSYCGRAPAGTAEAADEWTITRITVATNGSVTIAVSSPVSPATGVAWDDYLTATYA